MIIFFFFFGARPRPSQREFVDSSTQSLRAPAECPIFTCSHTIFGARLPSLSPFSQAVLDCKGTVFFSGVGKSGFISQKISMTLVSTGTKSVFLNPTDALHGDIGIVGQDDLLVLFSKSGATEELIKLIPYAKVREAIQSFPSHTRAHIPETPLHLLCKCNTKPIAMRHRRASRAR